MITKQAIEQISQTVKQSRQYPVALYLCRSCRQYFEDESVNSGCCSTCETVFDDSLVAREDDTVAQEQSFFFELPTRDELNLFNTIKNDTLELEQSFFFQLPSRDELNLFNTVKQDTMEFYAYAC
jgi:hypothetical protein